jgi:four helix bundle protein
MLHRLPRASDENRDEDALGRSTDPDRKHFFLIARGSTAECAAILDVCRVMNLVEAGDFEEAKALAERIVSMLTKKGR